MVKYIKKFNQMMEVVNHLEKKGYSIRICHNGNLVLETGSNNPNYLLKNTVGNIKIRYIPALKLISKLGLSLIK